MSESESGQGEEFCRHPVGAAPMPVAVPHTNQLSQRALLLSLGALALSVVAMTTMFIFVYSHGSGALESAAHHATVRSQQLAAQGNPTAAPPRLAASRAIPLPAFPLTAAPTPVETAPATRLADATPAQSCAKRQDPLYRASVVELSADGESGIMVQRKALQAASQDGCD